MTRPDLKAVSIIPNPAQARAAITVEITVDDIEIIFGTEYKYARSSDYEIYTGEDGLI